MNERKITLVTVDDPFCVSCGEIILPTEDVVCCHSIDGNIDGIASPKLYHTDCYEANK